MLIIFVMMPCQLARLLMPLSSLEIFLYHDTSLHSSSFPGLCFFHAAFQPATPDFSTPRLASASTFASSASSRPPLHQGFIFRIFAGFHRLPGQPEQSAAIDCLIRRYTGFEYFLLSRRSSPFTREFSRHVYRHFRYARPSSFFSTRRLSRRFC